MMTTSISNEAPKKTWIKIRTKRFFVKLENRSFGYKITKPFSRIFNFLILIFCMLTERLAVKVNYILDAQNNGKFNFDIIIHKKYEN